MSEPQFYTERVPCCVCGASGKVPHRHFWRKDCPVCEGTGKRLILLTTNLSPGSRHDVLLSAIYGILPPVRGQSELDQIIGSVFDFF